MRSRLVRSLSPGFLACFFSGRRCLRHIWALSRSNTLRCGMLVEEAKTMLQQQISSMDRKLNRQKAGHRGSKEPSCYLPSELSGSPALLSSGSPTIELLSSSRYRACKGFTLVEVLVTIGILAILLSTMVGITRTGDQQVLLSKEQSLLLVALNRAKASALQTFFQPNHPCGYGIFIDIANSSYTQGWLGWKKVCS